MIKKISDSAWNLEIRASDKFGTSFQSLIIPKGMPILFFHTKKLSVGINCFPQKNESFEISGKTIFDMVYPIGAIYLSVNNTNPKDLFGGTWEQIQIFLYLFLCGKEQDKFAY